jgi:curli production assembly/transport CsgH protein
MSKTWLALSLAPLALAAVAAFGSAPTPHATSGARCEVRMTKIPEGLEIAGVMHGRPGATGSYQLRLAKSGAGGDSQVSQGGTYTISADSQTTVSESDFNPAPGDVYRVSMTATGAGGSVHCDLRAP